MVQTHKAVNSSSILAIKSYGHSVVIMDLEQWQKKAEVFMTVDNFIAIAIWMEMLVRETI